MPYGDLHNANQYEVGDCVSINNKYYGVIKYIGPIDGKEDMWVGLELDRPVGKNSGVYKNKRYFDCKSNCGIFIKYDKIRTDEKDMGGMTTEDIINKYSNYSQILDREDDKYKYIENDINRKYDGKLEGSKLFDDYEQMKEECNTKLSYLEDACDKMSKHFKNTDTEHETVVNLVNEILEAYRKNREEEFNSKIEEFANKMNEYGIKYNK